MDKSALNTNVEATDKSERADQTLICIMAGKALLALSICIYGFYVLLSPNFTNPVDNDLDKTTMFMRGDYNIEG